MESVKILIVENELIVAELLSQKLSEVGYQITDVITRGESVKNAVSQQIPDLVIMDIDLDGKMDGIQAVAEIRKQAEIPVIYLTDLDNEEIVKRASATKPSAYLLKPFNERQVAVSIQQALYNASEDKVAFPADSNLPKQEQFILNDVIFVRQNNNHYKKILLSSISYIEADGAYCNIHLTNKEKYTYSISMNHIHDRIAKPLFVRANRSNVVNLDRVAEVKGNILLVDGVEIQIGDTYKDAVMKRLPFLR
jgi:CheY-like chemotaxis protein